jgi:alpha-L-fucosidase
MKFLLIVLPALFLLAGVQASDKLPKPTALQMEWQKLENIAFIHFSINTFTDMEWGYGNESPALFNPVQLNCRQWVKICKDAGMKGIILTAKHHDGFCLWPSKYTQHSVKNSPWKNGQGDVVREFSDACKEYGLKMGLYLSPWDCNHPEYGKAGYNDYFKNQLTELLTNYGDLFEIWFDGANGGRGYYGTDSLHNRSITEDYYDWKGFVGLVHKLQPNCIVHGGGLPDIRWVGNEEGHAAETHWSTIRANGKFDENKSHPQQLNTGHEDGTMWLPSETDVSLRPGWYYHAFEDHKVKTLPKLMDIYYESVGHNSLLLLNLSPDKRGLVHPIDSIRLKEWKHQLDLDFSENLISKKCKFYSSESKNVQDAFDNNFNTYWKANENTGYLEVDFKKEITCNRLLLQEYIPDGQKVKSFSVECWEKGKWKELTTATTIGYKRILRFLPVTTQKLRIRINEALAPPMISTIAVYNAPVLLSLPEIRRDQSGKVTILSPDKVGKIYYTTDGSQPTLTSSQYSGPFLLDGPVTVKAMVYNGTNSQGITTTRIFTGSKAGWKIVGESSQNPAPFDGNPGSTWTSKKGVTSIEIDLGSVTQVQGITYLPDQSRGNYGIALNYIISGSMDGKSWETITKGEFSNIRNNPIQQNIRFTQPMQVRFLKLGTTLISDGHPSLGIAEFDLLTQ